MKLHPKLKFLKDCFRDLPMPELRFTNSKKFAGLYQHPTRKYPTGCIFVNKDPENTKNDEMATIAHEFAHHVQFYQGYNQDNELNYWLIDEALKDRLTWDEMEAIYFQLPLERAAELFAWLVTGNEHSWRRLTLSGLNLPKKPPKNKKTIAKYRRMINEPL